MNAIKRLDDWYQKAKAEGRVVDVKFFPGIRPESSLERMSQAALELVTGVRKTVAVDTSKL